MFVAIGLLFGLASLVSAQSKESSGTPSQRVQVIEQKLEQMKRSVSSAIGALKKGSSDKKDKKGEKADLDSPLARLGAIEKDVRAALDEAINIRQKIDRADKYEKEDIGTLETRVVELQSAVDRVLVETAAARADSNGVDPDGKKKNKKKFLWLFGGTGNDEYDELLGSVAPGRDKELFVVATREVRRSNFEVGRLLFQTIITTYAESPYLPMAKLAVADSFFLEGTTSSLIQASAAYQEWLAFFPTHPLADRVLLKIAESEMRQIGLPDRDSSRARRAEQKLKALIQQYPNSLLRKEAEARLNEVQDNLGLHNLYIANYYYKLSVDQKKGGLKGAQSRYNEILEKYPNFSFLDEALFKLAVTYLVEEETDQAAKFFQRIVREYPNSPYIEKSKEQLKIIGAAIPETDPEKAKTLEPEKTTFFQNFRNELFGIYPMTIDKDGVLMTKDFSKERFELIDQIIENQGEILSNQIPQSLTTVISIKKPADGNEKPKQ
ncbi:MAG: outer membrane protein assembly factor BamD [Acidobacteriota bacterium]